MFDIVNNDEETEENTTAFRWTPWAWLGYQFD